jgi:hypothetical protein
MQHLLEPIEDRPNHLKTVLCQSTFERTGNGKTEDRMRLGEDEGSLLPSDSRHESQEKLIIFETYDLRSRRLARTDC